MAEVAVASAVVGTALSIKGQRDQAKAQAAAARQNAQAKREQALELLDRLEINNQALRQESAQLKARQKVSFAGRGIDIGTGAPLGVIEETEALTARQLALDKREANFKAKQLRAGADADMKLAGDIKKSSRLNQMATFFSGAGTAAGAMK